MNDIIKFTFDFFAHVLPGILILIAFSLFMIPMDLINKILDMEKSAKTPEEMLEYSEMVNGMMGNFDVGQGIIITLLAYIIGFAVTPFGKIIYKKIGKKIWKETAKIKNPLVPKMFISDQFVLVRHNSPANFEYIERWNIYCALSHNMAVACLVFFIVSCIQIFRDTLLSQSVWSFIAVISLFLFFVFVYSAVLYSVWAIHDLNASIRALKLREGSEN